MSKRLVVFATCLALLNVGSPLVARAELVGTLQAVEASTRAQDLAAVSAALARAEVRAQFAALGVDPAQVDARVAALTDAELRQLSAQMADLPAGADSALAVIGVVFLVLLILELVGVIDIFKKIP